MPTVNNHFPLIPVPKDLFPVKDLFLDFLRDRSEMNWPVVPWIVLLTFSEDEGNICCHLGISNDLISVLIVMI